jgi:SAM-dependent methyltransferase
MHKAALRRFLASNPYPKPWTDGLFYREKMRAIHRVAPSDFTSNVGTPHILEVGGGRSGMGARLYPQASVVTVDRDPTQLDLGSTRQGSMLVCGDACALPFRDFSFDVVTLFDVLEHIADDAKAAAEALRVTRPGGWVLLSTPCADWRYPFYPLMKPWCPDERELMAEWGHVRRGYCAEALERLFGGPPRRRASFINPVTAFFHDVSFSLLRGKARKLAYAVAAPATALGYVLHSAASRGTEMAVAWQRP